VYYDPLPDETDDTQRRRRTHQHFAFLDREYLPEPDLDEDLLYEAWTRKLGRPAILASYERELDPTKLVGLRGTYCCYLSRTVVSPVERSAYIVVGNNDAYRLYLNGELVAEKNECVWWTPFNNVHPVTLCKGPNHIIVKLLKRGDTLRFTLGLRAAIGKRGTSHNREDWLVDLADQVPGIG
jgi:hypothetical protein